MLRKTTRRTFLGGAAAAAARLRAETVGRSPITNRWGEAETTRLDLEEIPVFLASEGKAYSHHQQVIFDRGTLYLSWSLGIRHEDNPGQQMVLATSRDEGRTWSKESVISPPLPSRLSAYTAMGIRKYRDELHAYYGHYAWAERALGPDQVAIIDYGTRYREKPGQWVHRDTWADVRASGNGGSSWQKPIRFMPNFCPNLRPFPVKSGRLIVPGNITFPYTDDPAGLHGWKNAGIPRLPEWTVDDPEGFHNACYVRGDEQEYCEGSFYQTDDGKIHMMLRTLPIPPARHNGLMAVSESSDNGKTWSEPMMTSYSDSCCRFQFGRLPDGRYFGLSCPDPKGPRAPMVLALSKDGVVFDRHFILGGVGRVKPRLAGNHKGGTYGYPSCDIADGKMFITFSRNKEDIYFCSLKLNALG